MIQGGGYEMRVEEVYTRERKRYRTGEVILEASIRRRERGPSKGLCAAVR